MLTLEPLINPKTIAVIGASSNPEKIGYQILANLQTGGYAGGIYPVNIKQEPILGMESKANISDIEVVVDLAVIVIPSAGVKEEVRKCIEKGVRSIIVISAGFGEVGEEGKKLQDEIADMCNKAGVVLLGPNCFGLINTHDKINTTFSKNYPESGPVSFFSQSGAIISSIIDISKSANLGFGKIISMGNKAGIREADILEYLYQDPNTKVILGYLESLAADDKLSNVLLTYAKAKPTVVIFGGKSDFGQAAAKSHTGSIVSSYTAVHAYLRQAGVLVVDTLDEFLVMARVFSRYQTIRDNNIAVVTNAGGPGILASDAIHFHKMRLAPFSDQTKEALKSSFRPEAGLHNPVDVLGDASDTDYQKAIDIIGADPNVSGIVVILTPQTATKIDATADIIINHKGDRPLITSFIGGEFVAGAKKRLRQANVPCFDYPEVAVEAMAALAGYSNLTQGLVISDKTNEWIFDLDKKQEALDNWGFPTLKYFEVDQTNAAQKADELGYPVVLKTADKNVIHKTEAGGVKLNIEDAGQLTSSLDGFRGRAVIGKMIIADHEVFVGVKRDDKLGGVVAFGTGGIYAELYNDMSFRTVPVNHDIAREMVLETKMGKILTGIRGVKPYDLDKLLDIIVKASYLIKDFKNITEIDFNPILVNRDGYYIVDARIIVNE